LLDESHEVDLPDLRLRKLVTELGVARASPSCGSSSCRPPAANAAIITERDDCYQRRVDSTQRSHDAEDFSDRSRDAQDLTAEDEHGAGKDY
jgi:hypothetical protein